MLKDLIIELSAIIGSATVILAVVNKYFITPILNKIEYEKKDRIKTTLVNFISDLENGEPKSEIQKINAREMYDYYISHNGNSYVHDHWEQLKKEGKI